MLKLVRLVFRVKNFFKLEYLKAMLIGYRIYLRRLSFTKKGLLGILLVTLAVGVLVGQMIAVRMFEKYAERMSMDKAVLVKKNREKAFLIADLETRLGLKQGKGKKVGWR